MAFLPGSSDTLTSIMKKIIAGSLVLLQNVNEGKGQTFVINKILKRNFKFQLFHKFQYSRIQLIFVTYKNLMVILLILLVISMGGCYIDSDFLQFCSVSIDCFEMV